MRNVEDLVVNEMEGDSVAEKACNLAVVMCMRCGLCKLCHNKRQKKDCRGGNTRIDDAKTARSCDPWHDGIPQASSDLPVTLDTGECNVKGETGGGQMWAQFFIACRYAYMVPEVMLTWWQ